MAARGLMTFCPVYLGALPPIGSNMLVRFRIDVSACRDPHPPCHGTQVGDDVSEHVVGDNHIKPLRVLDKPHGGGIHVA